MEFDFEINIIIRPLIDTILCNVVKDIDKYGCIHYDRGCKVRCSDCLEFFSCRFCHDKVKNEDELDIKKAHTINRFKIDKIQCNFCNKIQDVSQSCIGCGTIFAKYFCNKCNLFDDKRQNIYHCDKCGLCRILDGKAFHCDICNCCYNKHSIHTHKCRKNKMETNCPICLESFFHSRKLHMDLECGHLIHVDCFFNYANTGEFLLGIVKCPMCNKTINKIDNNVIKQFINQNPMPVEYNKKVNILCNDCNEKSLVDFHFIAMQCLHCESFNTNRVS